MYHRLIKLLRINYVPPIPGISYVTLIRKVNRFNHYVRRGIENFCGFWGHQEEYKSFNWTRTYSVCSKCRAEYNSIPHPKVS